MSEEQNADTSTAAQVVDLERPWLGLKSFGEDDTVFFFGRQRERQEILRCVQHRHTTVLYGGSGFGKTSLIRAGLTPDLLIAGYQPVFHRIRYGSEEAPPAAQLIAVLANIYNEEEILRLTDLYVLLHDPALGFCGPFARYKPPAFLLDQFEEVFTLGAALNGTLKGRRDFVAEVRDLLAVLGENFLPQQLATHLETDEELCARLDQESHPSRVVLSLREDYVFALDRWRRELPSLGDNRYELLPLSGEKAYLAVVEPGKLRNSERPIVTTECAIEIVRFVAGDREQRNLDELTIVPPLLSLLCAELNEQRLAAGEGVIRPEQLKGRAENILERFYERCFSSQPTAVRTFVEERLLSTSGFRESTTLDTATTELVRAGLTNAAAMEAIARLVDARLLSTEERGGVQRIELTHDILTRVAYRSREKQTLRQLGNDKWLLAVQARDDEKDVLRAAHLFLRSAQAFESAGQSVLAKNATLAAALTAGAVVSTFLQNAAILGAIVTANRMLTWSEDGKARVWGLDKEDWVQGFKHFSTAGEKMPIQTFEHEKLVTGASFSCDGNDVLTWSEDGMARLWALDKKDPVRSFKHEKSVTGASFSCDGSRILTWSEDGMMRVWAVDKENWIQSFDPEGSVAGAAFSHDANRIVAWSDQGSVRISAVSGKKLIQNFIHNPSVIGAVFDEDQGRILTWSKDGTTRLWALGRREPIQIFEHKGSVNGAAFIQLESDHAESMILTWSEDGTARLWALGKREPIRIFEHKGSVIGATFIKDKSQILTWSKDGTAQLWPVDDKEPVRRFNQRGSVDGALFNGRNECEGWILTLSRDGTARLWTVGRSEPIEPIKRFKHAGDVFGASFSHDGKRILTWSRDRTWCVWTLGQEKPMSVTQKEPVNGAKFNKGESRVLTWGRDGTAQLWDVGQKRKIRSFDHGGSVFGAKFDNEENRVLTWGDDGMARLWALDEEDAVRSFEHKGYVFGASFDESERQILTWGDNGWIRLWALDEKDPIEIYQGGSVYKAEFDKSGNRILTWGDEGSAQLWVLGEQKPMQVFSHERAVYGATFNAGETRLLTWGDDRMARLWVVGHSEPIEIFEHMGSVYGARFNQTEDRILTWSNDGAARLWALDKKEPPLTFTHMSSDYRAEFGATFSPDENLILTWGFDGMARLWSVGHQKPIQSFRDKGIVYGATFSPDGSQILTWGADGTVRLWDISVDEKIPLHERMLEFEVRSGTWLDELGELRVLSFDAWIAKKRELSALAAKHLSIAAK